MRHKFNCWNFIFAVKKSQENSEFWQSKNIAVYISTFQGNIFWSGPNIENSNCRCSWRKLVCPWKSNLTVEKKIIISTFQEFIWWSAPMFKSVILVDLKENRLCCSIFLGSRCIRCIRSSHRYKFEDTKWKNVTFSYCSFKTNTVQYIYYFPHVWAWFWQFLKRFSA